MRSSTKKVGNPLQIQPFSSDLLCHLQRELATDHGFLNSSTIYKFGLAGFLIFGYLSTPSRIDPFRFQAGGHRRLPNLVLVFCVLILCCSIFCYGCMFASVVCFHFSVLSQEIGWEEHLQNDLFCVRLDEKH